MRCRTLGKAAGSLERSGMDPIGDLVVAGGLSAVLAQDHDRFAREPAYLSYLRRRSASMAASSERLTTAATTAQKTSSPTSYSTR
jgi:hypothetical protein